jgi:hypothetical protein
VLQPRRRHRQPRDFGDHGAQSVVAQSFLEAAQHSLVVTAFDVDHARRRQAGLGDRGHEKIGPRQAPQHLASRSRSASGGEQGRRGAVHGAIAAAGNFVQRPEGKTAVGKNPVDRIKAERKRVPAPARSLKSLDALSQLVDDGTGHAHPPPSVRYGVNGHVLGMFETASERVNRGCSVRTRENCDFPGDLVAIQREVAEI